MNSFKKRNTEVVVHRFPRETPVLESLSDKVYQKETPTQVFF